MLRTAQIGLGWWGSQVTKVLKGSSKIEIVCGVDPALAIAERYTQAHGLPVYPDFQTVLDDPSVEAVILTIPHRLHEDALLRATAAGKQVFCEKPLALEVASARRMIAACDRAGIVLGIGHERRFEPAWEEMKRMADAGERAPLLAEPGHGTLVPEKGRGEELHRDLAIEGGIEGHEHLPHPSAAEAADVPRASATAARTWRTATTVSSARRACSRSRAACRPICSIIVR